MSVVKCKKNIFEHLVSRIFDVHHVRLITLKNDTIIKSVFFLTEVGRTNSMTLSGKL